MIDTLCTERLRGVNSVHANEAVAISTARQLGSTS